MNIFKNILALFLILFALSCSSDKNETKQFSNQVNALNGAAAITGRVDVTAGCIGPIQVALYSDSALQNPYTPGPSAVYPPTSVNAGGTFEMHVQPGNYLVWAQGQNGCSTTQRVSTVANQTMQVSLMIAPGGTPAPSTGYSPCNWYSYGCGSSTYPGTGSFVAGKPNVYFSGPTGTKISAKLRLPAGSTLLSAIPIHGQKGWEGVIQSDGSIKVDNVNYSFLFYDLRGDHENLKSDRVACVTYSNVVSTMADYLKAKGFLKNEINDFNDYWTKRIPNAKEYCIYLQETDSISRAAELEITPKPESVIQVWFLLIPQNTKPLTKSFAKFNSKPQILARTLPRPITRSIASKKAGKTLEIREWGVGFLMENQ